MKKSVARLLSCMLIFCLLLSCAAFAESNKDRPLKNDKSAAAAESGQSRRPLKNDKSAAPAGNADSTETAENAEAAATVLWTGDDGLFTMEIPADWTEYDADMMLQLLKDQVDAGAMDEAGMNEAMQEGMLELEGLYAMFYGPDWSANTNISVEESEGLDYIKYAPIMIASIEAQYEKLGITLDVAEVRTIGAHECIVTEVEYLGSRMTQALVMTPDKTKMITFTFTDFEPEVRDAVIASLSFAE